MNQDANLVDLSAAALAAAAGDQAAARSILDAFQHDVYGLALRMLGHPTDAEDAAQEILVIVLTHLGSFRGESSLKTWVLRIAGNHLSRAQGTPRNDHLRNPGRALAHRPEYGSPRSR